MDKMQEFLDKVTNCIAPLKTSKDVTFDDPKPLYDMVIKLIALVDHYRECTDDYYADIWDPIFWEYVEHRALEIIK